MVKNLKKQFPLIALLAFGLTLAIITFGDCADASYKQRVSWSQFHNLVSDGSVKRVVIYNGDGKIVAHTNLGQKLKTVTTVPIDPSLQKTLTEKGIEVNVVAPSNFGIGSIISLLFLALIVYAVVGFGRSVGRGGMSVNQFARSRAKIVTEKSKVTFKDVAGIDEVLEELTEITDFLKNPKKFTRLGARIPKGVLLSGEPGTGKTLLARAIAGEADVPFITTAGSKFVELFVGVGAARVRDLFEMGVKNAPCIIFIDEIDAVGKQRQAGIGGGVDEREQTLNELLTEMDGFESKDGIIIIAATNRPEIIDSALLRPGRFDRRITVPKPDLIGRKKILEVHAKKVKLDRAVDLETIARGTPGFTGADLENLVNEAALFAVRKNRDTVGISDFEAAKNKIIMGAARKGMFLSEKDKRLTAIHEAGHALAGKRLVEQFGEDDADPVHKVTIIPHRNSLGTTLFLPTDDKLTTSKEYILNKITAMLAGRAAEEIVLGKITTGAANDIEVATYLAQKMVREWGMSERLGLRAFPRGIKIYGEETDAHNYSIKTAVQIDEEISRVIDTRYVLAKEIIKNNRSYLDALVAALLDHETAEADELNALLQKRENEENEKQ